jgi:hypothetical protein
VLVRYRVGGETKQQYFPYAALICLAPEPCGDGKFADGRDASEQFKQQTLIRLGLVPAGAYR